MNVNSFLLYINISYLPRLKIYNYFLYQHKYKSVDLFKRAPKGTF